MDINIITATDQNNGIGIDNSLPWKVPSDLNYFKEKTLNKVIVMGRKTLESLPGILPNREHWVLSTKEYTINNKVTQFKNIEELINFAKERKTNELWIIGGAEIYAQFLPLADNLYITQIGAKTKANRFFPTWNRRDFQLQSIYQGIKTDKDEYSFDFYHWTKSK